MNTNQSNTTVDNTSDQTEYAARLEIDYPEKSGRLATFFRPILIIPIAIIFGMISRAGETIYYTDLPRPSGSGCEDNSGNGWGGGK